MLVDLILVCNGSEIYILWTWTRVMKNFLIERSGGNTEVSVTTERLLKADMQQEIGINDVRYYVMDIL
jgi:hypothetical protein